jgi:hypothetical protein
MLDLSQCCRCCVSPVLSLEHLAESLIRRVKALDSAFPQPVIVRQVEGKAAFHLV